MYAAELSGPVLFDETIIAFKNKKIFKFGYKKGNLTVQKIKIEK